MTTSAPVNAATGLSYRTVVSDPIPIAGMHLPDGTPMMWSPLTTTLITGQRDAVLVDPPFTVDQAQRIGDWIEQSGKRLTHIYITHGHGDHWFAAPTLVERFPGVVVVATEGTIARMRAAAGPAREQMWDRWFPGQLPETPVIAQPVGADGFELEGHRLHAVRAGHSDTDDSTALYVPSMGLVVAGDVAYNGVHQYLAEGGNGGLEAWLLAIDTIAALEPRIVVAGHKNKALPDDPTALDDTRRYLRDAIGLLADKPGPREFFDSMLARYPDRLNPGTVWLSANLLLG
ncbi:MBL fold metallo-hydrolase [Nocardia sp. CDC159]|uniref:MBL fold metallo-hydrolase n=1 Tax=Nocardia pulmonis TaxID=2951408 RepID=A0A9X2IXU4_9NOCA|nr:MULTISPECIES: MBL fold metallo-hydrolase [Nocardia]MCM6776377.1 MBL fold metallo-hydrolase [Nocardia pulmonis]MCM6788801.1 MBL fold metallo-hydrolase [Nocardia sp. CDC159]